MFQTPGPVVSAFVKPLAVAVLTACSSVVWSAEGVLPAEPFGKDGAAGRCVVCHSLEKGGPFRSAPNLFGIVGSDVARFGWFGYSASLQKRGGKWTEERLDEYLKNPVAFAPGTKKTFSPIADADLRRDIINYLKTLN